MSFTALLWITSIINCNGFIYSVGHLASRLWARRNAFHKMERAAIPKNDVHRHVYYLLLVSNCIRK